MERPPRLHAPVPRARAGRWSATPATSRIRSAPTASPMPSATPSCSPAPCSTARRDATRRSTRSPTTRTTRDRLSVDLFDIADRIASQQWDDAEISELLLQLSASMADEVELLSALDRGARGMSRRTLLGVWAHPDDEAYLSAGLMAEFRRRGDRVVVVTATLGERGTSDPVAWPPERLAVLRERELRSSLAAARRRRAPPARLRGRRVRVERRHRPDRRAHRRDRARR